MVRQTFCSIITNQQVDDYSLGWSERKRKRNYFKMATKLKEKRTSITTVPSTFRPFATFPTHLLFHYPLPLKYKREHLNNFNFHPIVCQLNVKEALKKICHFRILSEKFPAIL
jgi:hypothetical protein